MDTLVKHTVERGLQGRLQPGGRYAAVLDILEWRGDGRDESGGVDLRPSLGVRMDRLCRLLPLRCEAEMM